MTKQPNVGLRTTYLNEDLHFQHYYPEFIATLQKHFKESNQPLKVAFQRLHQPTPKGYSHRVFFDLTKAETNKEAS